MDASDLRSAYERFLETANAYAVCEESDPAGWTVATVVAHIAANDRLIAAHLRRAMAGEPTAYDNRSVYRAAELQPMLDGQPDVRWHIEDAKQDLRRRSSDWRRSCRRMWWHWRSRRTSWTGTSSRWMDRSRWRASSGPRCACTSRSTRRRIREAGGRVDRSSVGKEAPDHDHRHVRHEQGLVHRHADARARAEDRRELRRLSRRAGASGPTRARREEDRGPVRRDGVPPRDRRFMIQGGDPTGTGPRRARLPFEDEFPPAARRSTGPACSRWRTPGRARTARSSSSRSARRRG